MKRNLLLFGFLIGLLAVSRFTISSLNALSIPSESTPRILRLDPRIDAIVPKDAILEKVAHGFGWVEGPVWNRKDMSLLFSDVPGNQILQWREGRPIAVFLNHSGYTGMEPFEGKEPGSNGLSFDPQGRLVFCQHGDRKISRIEKDGSMTTLVDRYMGKRLNSPNDVIFRSNGDMYFTDPPFGLPKTFEDPDKELAFQGIYRFSKNGSLSLLNKELRGPNGIAFSPHEKKMYVSDPILTAWFVFDMHPDGSISNRRVFVNGKSMMKNGPGGPDGMKVDQNGNIFSAGPGGLYIFSADGSILGRFDFGVPTGNCAWGEDGSTLFIAANTAIYRVRLHTEGTGWKFGRNRR